MEFGGTIGRDGFFGQQSERPRREPREAEPLPADLSLEPHQALAATVLRSSAEQAQWRAEGGPEPVLPGYWSTLWQAAVQRQCDLSGEPEAQANESVSTMMSQLGTLQHEAAWFRDDDELRRRAVAEILLYGTRLAPDVPSRAAQEAWNNSADWKAAWTAWSER